MRQIYKKFITVALFAIAMAFLESAIVIYLRNISAAADPGFIYSIEIAREFATLIMLACIGLLAGRERYEKFAFFMYAFAIWDIFYYIFLKLTLDWPASVLTGDVLFLIPLKWTSPVLAPILVSATMLLFAFAIEKSEQTKKKVKLNLREELLLVLGSLIILFSFVYQNSFSQNIQQIFSYIPVYDWTLFVLGEIIALTGIALFYFRYKK